jgi:hypothetical protein
VQVVEADAVTALLQRNAELLKEWHRVVAACVRASAEPTPEQQRQLAGVATHCGTAIRLLAGMADTNGEWMKTFD